MPAVGGPRGFRVPQNPGMTGAARAADAAARQRDLPWSHDGAGLLPSGYGMILFPLFYF